MDPKIAKYHSELTFDDSQIAVFLFKIISEYLPKAEHKIWHGHPVWFLDGNPIVGYSKQKKGMRLMFWSGKSFHDEKLNVLGKKFYDASIFYNQVSEIIVSDLIQWLDLSTKIQWDYKNIVKRRGVLERI